MSCHHKTCIYADGQALPCCSQSVSAHLFNISVIGVTVRGGISVEMDLQEILDLSSYGNTRFNMLKVRCETHNSPIPCYCNATSIDNWTPGGTSHLKLALLRWGLWETRGFLSTMEGTRSKRLTKTACAGAMCCLGRR